MSTVSVKNNSSSNITKRFKEIELKDYKAKVVIPVKLANDLKQVSLMAGKDEWSGILYWILEGNLDKKDIICKCTYFYPMDIGSSSYTEHKYETDFVDVFTEKPELLKTRMAHVHSHATMGVFFSGTDVDELHDNADNHHLYLSVIVNNKLDVTAKICFTGEVETKASIITRFRNLLGINTEDVANVDTKEKVLYIINPEIVIESESVDKFIEDRMKSLLDKKAEESTANAIKIAGYGDTYSRGYTDVSKLRDRFKNQGENAYTDEFGFEYPYVRDKNARPSAKLITPSATPQVVNYFLNALFDGGYNRYNEAINDSNVVESINAYSGYCELFLDNDESKIKNHLIDFIPDCLEETAHEFNYTFDAEGWGEEQWSGDMLEKSIEFITRYFPKDVMVTTYPYLLMTIGCLEEANDFYTEKLLADDKMIEV